MNRDISFQTQESPAGISDPNGNLLAALNEPGNANKLFNPKT